METKPKKQDKKEKDNGKLVLGAAGIGALVYLFCRTKIEILTIDHANLELTYRATIGFKKVEGTLNLFAPTAQEHIFYGRTLTAAALGKTICLQITNKQGKVLDHAVVDFTNNATSVFELFNRCQLSQDTIVEEEATLQPPTVKGGYINADLIKM